MSNNSKVKRLRAKLRIDRPNDDSNGAFYTLNKTVCFYLKVPDEQSKFGSLPRFFKRWMALSIGQISIQWIKIRKTDYVIHWKEIYLVDSVIHLSKNWALVVCYTAVFRVVTQRSSCGEERRVTTLKTAV